MDSAVLSSKRKSDMNSVNTNTQAAETETWEAWLDGKRDEAVEFQVPVGGTFDVAAAGAQALGVEVSEELNVARA